jgi:hypothetical protein
MHCIISSRDGGAQTLELLHELRELRVDVIKLGRRSDGGCRWPALHCSFPFLRLINLDWKGCFYSARPLVHHVVVLCTSM